jgi:acetyl esterase
MEKILNKTQNIKKAKQLQAAMKIYTKISNFFILKRNIDRKELYIESDCGKAHLLCYGFTDSKIKPVYFDMHGGGFVLGSAYMDDSINVEIMNKAGCKVVSIDYVKAPDFPFPAAVNQVYSVVKHFYENSEKYRIDTKKMAIGGHSAGANLSTVTCIKAKQIGDFQFRCQVLDYPVLDLLTDPNEKPQPKGAISPAMMKMFNDCYLGTEKANNLFASPVFATMADLQDLPSAMILLAGLDSLYNEGKQYAKKLKEANVVVDLLEYENEKHGFTYEKSQNRNDAVNKISKYIYDHLI